LQDPHELRNTEINLDHRFAKTYINKVMMNQFDNCACFHMDPAKPDAGAKLAAEREKDIVWIRFKDEMEAEDLSADAIAQMFADIGDYQVYKDTKNSCIINFFYIDKDVIAAKSP